MVKGNTRQVIVIKSPDKALFEQAIFLLREDALTQGGVSDSDLLQQAREACRKEDRKISGSFERLFWYACGALTVILLWIFLTLI